MQVTFFVFTGLWFRRLFQFKRVAGPQETENSIVVAGSVAVINRTRCSAIAAEFDGSFIDITTGKCPMQWFSNYHIPGCAIGGGERSGSVDFPFIIRPI